MKYDDTSVIYDHSISGEGGVLKSICRYLMRFDLHEGMEQVEAHSQQIADLRETLGGVERQVHELRTGDLDEISKLSSELRRLHHRIGVEETRTSRSLTGWASAGYPLLLERAETAERERDEFRRRLAEIEGIAKP